MSCDRCEGMMINDCLIDDGGRVNLPIWRCLVCGEIIDVLILSHRAEKTKTGRQRNQTSPFVLSR